MKKEGENSFGILSVSLGIVALAISLISFIPGLALGIVGLIFGIKQKKINKNKWSKSGIILAVFVIILNLILFGVTAWLIANNPGIFQFA